MADVNPLQYRGYYYDADTEFYYLQSRYYDPAICRFINADEYAFTEQGILGCNMFSYCQNSSVFNEDSLGNLDSGDNYIRDSIFKGDQLAYDVYPGVTETVAVVGTAVCGNYLRNTCTMKGAVPGSEGKTTLQPGQQLDRYGSEYGRYLTDPGTSTEQLALTPGNTRNLTSCTVNKSFAVSTGTVAACEWGIVGGTQYFTWRSVRRLIQLGYISQI